MSAFEGNRKCQIHIILLHIRDCVHEILRKRIYPADMTLVELFDSPFIYPGVSMEELYQRRLIPGTDIQDRHTSCPFRASGVPPQRLQEAAFSIRCMIQPRVALKQVS